MHRQISHPLAVFMSCYVYLARSLWYLTIREGTLDVTCSPPSFCFLPNLINTLKPSQIKRELSPRHWLAFKAPLSMCTKAPSPEKRKTIQISQGFQHELVKGWVYCKSVLPNPTLSSEAIQPHLYIRGLQAAGWAFLTKAQRRHSVSPAGTGLKSQCSCPQMTCSLVLKPRLVHRVRKWRSIKHWMGTQPQLQS